MQLATLGKLVAMNKNITKEVDGSSSTPIHYAARYGRLEMLKVRNISGEPRSGLFSHKHGSVLHSANCSSWSPTLTDLFSPVLSACMSMIQIFSTQKTTVA